MLIQTPRHGEFTLSMVIWLEETGSNVYSVAWILRYLSFYKTLRLNEIFVELVSVWLPWNLILPEFVEYEPGSHFGKSHLDTTWRIAEVQKENPQKLHAVSYDLPSLLGKW